MQTTEQGVLALAQARGDLAFSVVPFHCMYYYMQSYHCQALFLAGGICATHAAEIFNPYVALQP